MSKGLEALNDIISVDKEALKLAGKSNDTILHRRWLNEKAAIIEKELKALEIIKKKQVNVGVLIHHITDKHLLGLESYNFMWGGTPERQLTPEEYDILKGELK